MPPEDVSLRDYLEVKLESMSHKMDDQAKYIEQHFKLNELAITKAEDAMINKLESMNEWRGQSKDREASFASKETVAGIEKNVKQLELSEAKIAGKADQTELTTTKIIAVVGILLGLAGILINVFK
jgi:hypothetical protein